MSSGVLAQAIVDLDKSGGDDSLRFNWKRGLLIVLVALLIFIAVKKIREKWFSKSEKFDDPRENFSNAQQDDAPLGRDMLGIPARVTDEL